MSVEIMAAVWRCGPEEQVPMLVLLAIADNSDDFGFSCPSQELIAMKARCDKRTTIRHIAKLEQAGWLGVLRKSIPGKQGLANAYFVNIARLGVAPSPNSRLSPLHRSLQKSHGDKLSRIFLPPGLGDTETGLRDNPQPDLVTPEADYVTNEAREGDTRCHPNRITITSEPSSPESPKNLNTPLPPKGGAGRDNAVCWMALRTDLKLELERVPEMSRFQPIRIGQTDYDASFRDLRFEDLRYTWGRPFELVLSAANERDSYAGLVRYRARLAPLLRKTFHMPPGVSVQIVLGQHPPINLAT